MTLFKTKVLNSKPGSDQPKSLTPMGVVEAGFQLAYLANENEVDSFRVYCIEEIERVCDTLKRSMRTANDKLVADRIASGAKLN